MTLQDSPPSTRASKGSSFGRGALASGADRLAAFVNRLSTAGVDKMPVDQAAGTIEMMADEQLKSWRESAQAAALAQQVGNWYRRCQAARTQYERLWYKNLDMVQGRQYTAWSEAKNALVQKPGLPYEPRLTINILEPMIRTELAKIGGSHPNVTIVPASNEEEDLMAARAGEQVWDWGYDVGHVDTKLRQAQWWASVTGNGFLKDYWDHGAEDPAVAPAMKPDASAGLGTINPATGMFDVPTPAPKATPGCIKVQAVTPFHIYVPDLTELNIQDQPYVLHVYPMNLETARQRYAKFIGPEWVPSKASGDQVVQSGNLLGGKGTNTAVPDTVIVVEAHFKPEVTPYAPKGGVVIMIEKEIIAASVEGMPYRHGEFPFHHITHIETGSFYRKSAIETMTPLQDDLNRMYSQMTKHRNLMLAPQFFYDAGSVDVRRIQNRPGTWIPIALGANKPVPVPLPELPNTFWQFLAKLREEADNISGQHDVSRAVSPGSDTAASAISVLQEADNNFMFDRISSTEQVLQGLARHYVALAVQFWDTPRIVKVVGDDGALDVKQLQGSDLEKATDIRVESGSGLPEGKAARIAVIQDMMKNGFVQPEDGLKELEMGNLRRIYRQTKVDEDQAARENLAMKGMDPEVAKQKIADAQIAAALQDTIDEAEEEETARVLSEQMGGGQMGAGAAQGGAPSPVDPAADPAAQDDPFAGVQDANLGLDGSQPAPEAPADPTAPAGAAPEGLPTPTAPAAPPVDPMAGMAGAAGGQSVLAQQAQTPTAVPVHDWDNHLVHIKVHERFMKSQEFERLDVAVQQIFVQHRQAHIEAAGNQAMLQNGMGGEPSGYAGPQPGAPSPAPAA